MDPLVISSGISTAGSLIGGLMGSHSASSEASKNRKEARRQFNIQQDNFMNQTQYRVEDALKAGINPLAALGVSSNVSPTISAGGDSGAGYQKGNAITRAAESLANIFNRQEKESRDLDLEAKRIRNRIALEELNHLRQPGLVGGNSSMEQPPIGSDSQLFRVAYDLNGDPRLMVNQDITENDADNAGYKSSLLHALRTGLINPVTGKVNSKQYLMFIDDAHYRATGRHISNLDRLYVSPAEFGIAAVDAYRGGN